MGVSQDPSVEQFTLCNTGVDFGPLSASWPHEQNMRMAESQLPDIEMVSV